MARFRRADIADFTARVAASGMVYKKRWGDAPLRCVTHLIPGAAGPRTSSTSTRHHVAGRSLRKSVQFAPQTHSGQSELGNRCHMLRKVEARLERNCIGADCHVSDAGKPRRRDVAAREECAAECTVRIHGQLGL